MASLNPTQRLQKIFEAYDVNGDGTLSEEEMTQVFEQLGIKGSSYVFKQADKNKDGTIQSMSSFRGSLAKIPSVLFRKM